MAEQPKWSSSRVANLRAAQNGPPAKGGTQQSRWAIPSSAPSSSRSDNEPTSSSGSSWRSRANDAAVSLSTSTSNRSEALNSRAARPGGASASRWSTASSSASRDSSVSVLTDTLQRTAISQPPSIQLHSSQAMSSSRPHQSVVRSDGLQPRDPTRPLGGGSLDRLALLASPSRGLDSSSALSTELSSQGSMDLTSASVQLELREYISTRITTKAIPLFTPSTGGTERLGVLDSARYLPQTLGTAKAAGVGRGEEELQQILLLVRKLREALVASKRVDTFTVEVYELSAMLALLCGDATQLATTLPRLTLELYPSVESRESVAQGVEQLCVQLAIDAAPAGERRMRMVSLHLLQTLCLSGRATRLGQYAADPTSALETLHRGRRDYRPLRHTLSEVYGAQLQPHLAFCDAVDAALRETSPFRLSALVQGSTGYAVDGWQRLVLLQVIDGMRAAAWAVARRAFLYLPISPYLVETIQPKATTAVPAAGEKLNETAVAEAAVNADYLTDLLLLNDDLLPVTSEQGKSESPPVKTDVPDEWDADMPSPTTTVKSKVQDARLHAVLLSHFGPALPDRVMAIKGGHGLKLK